MEVRRCWYVGLGQSMADSTWVALNEFRNTYPAFQLEDELLLQALRYVMHGKTYHM
jgi:hypothetical protein